MKIIDTHMHLGSCNIFNLEVTEKELNEYYEKNNITAAIVQPFPGAPNPREVHNKIKEFGAKYNKKIYGMASVNPHTSQEVLKEELERTIRELGFVAIKLHTAGHSISPENPRAKTIFDIASKNKVAVMVHTGPGPFSDPMQIASRAEEYPEVKIIIGHGGFGVHTAGTLYLAKKYDNIYIEPSWVPVYDLALFINEVPDKVVFGSDLIENTPVELAKINSLKLKDELKEKILYLNAKTVFGLDI